MLNINKDTFPLFTLGTLPCLPSRDHYCEAHMSPAMWPERSPKRRQREGRPPRRRMVAMGASASPGRRRGEGLELLLQTRTGTGLPQVQASPPAPLKPPQNGSQTLLNAASLTAGLLLRPRPRRCLRSLSQPSRFLVLYPPSSSHAGRKQRAARPLQLGPKKGRGL